MLEARIRNTSLQDKIITAEQAASLIQDGMVVGMSGFTRAGDAKAVPVAMAARAATDPFKITLITGASLGHDVDKLLTEAHVLSRRMPFQVDRTLRAAINRGEVKFIHQHLSETGVQFRAIAFEPDRPHRLCRRRSACHYRERRDHPHDIDRQFRELCHPGRKSHRGSESQSAHGA